MASRGEQRRDAAAERGRIDARRPGWCPDATETPSTQKQHKTNAGEGFAVLRNNGDVNIDAASLAKAAAVGRCVLKADDGARVVLRAVAAEAPTKVKRSFFSSLVLLASVLYTLYAMGLNAIFAIPLYAATLQKAYELLPEKVDEDRVAFSLTLEPPPKE